MGPWLYDINLDVFIFANGQETICLVVYEKDCTFNNYWNNIVTTAPIDLLQSYFMLMTLNLFIEIYTSPLLCSSYWNLRCLIMLNHVLGVTHLCVNTLFDQYDLIDIIKQVWELENIFYMEYKKIVCHRRKKTVLSAILS